MPLRVESARVALEWAARSIALAALLMLLWTLTRPQAPAGPELFEGPALDDALVRWTRSRPSDSLHLELTKAPDAIRRDWLRALRAAGVAVSWRAPAVPAIAVSTERIADPRSPTRVAIAGPDGAAMSVQDGVGPLDSLTIRSIGGTVIATATGDVRAELGGHVAIAPVADSVVLLRLLVLGPANWESRFVVAALEEHGWTVDARLEIAPGAVVRQGASDPVDTSRYAAILVLDSSGTRNAEQLSRYVRSGGGLILAGRASRAAGLGRLAPAEAGPRFEPTTGTASTNAGLPALGYYPLRPRTLTAVPLEHQDDIATVIAHRLEAGRVVQVGYDETWRWRMTGGDGGPEAHRAWWGAIVSAAAFAPTAASDAGRGTGPGEDAPLASLFASLGPPRPTVSTPAAAPTRNRGTPALLFALATAAFLAEWTSRRLRGAA